MLSNVVKHWERLERCRVFTVASCSFLFGFTYLWAPLVFQCPTCFQWAARRSHQWALAEAGRWRKSTGESCGYETLICRFHSSSVSAWKCDVLDNKDIWICMIYVCTKELKPVSGSRSTTKTSSKTSITTKRNLRPKAFSLHQVTRSFLQ